MKEYLNIIQFELCDKPQDTTITITTNSLKNQCEMSMIEGRIHLQYSCQTTGFDSLNELCSHVVSDIKKFANPFNLVVDLSLNRELVIESLLLALSDINVFNSAFSPPGKIKVYMSEELWSSYDVAYKKAVGYNLTRMLNHLPYKQCNSSTLSDEIVDLLGDENFKITINRRKECESLGLNGVLAVSQGSAIEPAVIKVEYNVCEGPKIGLVGKGIMLDSGGYNLKTGDLTGVKTDMAGCSAVIGCLKVISSLKLNVNVVAYLMTTDNLINESAYLPGDIVIYSNGISVEIGNTDAEGRMVLADGLLLIDREQCDVVIDIATLTGNSAMALGNGFAPLYSSNDDITRIFTSLNYLSTDNIWPMPMPTEYQKYIQGDISDLRNISNNAVAGSITAAVFLQYFAPKTNWVHIDIGAMSRKPEFNVPVNGYGVRLLTNFIIKYLEK